MTIKEVFGDPGSAGMTDPKQGDIGGTETIITDDQDSIL